MIFRIIIILVCVLVFINGCNSLVSGLVGTHKLRTFSIEQVWVDGVGDSDFIELTDVWSNGEYIFEPHRNNSWPGFVQWPVLDQAQFDSLKNGQKVNVSIVAWTKKYDKNCVDQKNCNQEGKMNLKGLVRPMNKRYNKMEELPKELYSISDDALYIEYNKSPLAWYWNLLLMLGAISIVLVLEQWLTKKEKKQKNDKS